MKESNIGKSVEVIENDDRYGFFGKVGDICRISHEFESMFIVVKTGGFYDSHAFAVDKNKVKFI